MRILIVTYWFPPATTPRAIRWSALADHWSKQGDEIHVICAGAPARPSERSENTVNTIRVPELLGRLTGGAAVARMATASGGADGQSSARRVVRLVSKVLHDHTWKQLYWPDHACLWYLPAVRKARQVVRSGRYDALITVSFPFTDHLVGLAIKSQNPALRWLVDVGDPFSFLTTTPPNNSHLYKSLNHFYEYRALKAADWVAVTTEPTLERYSSAFPPLASKLVLIPPLLPPLPTGADETSFFAGGNKIRLLFAGTLYKTIRSPKFLLKLFGRLLRTELGDKLELHFLGALGNCPGCFDDQKDLLGKKVFLHGPVGHRRAAQAVKEADCLVNIGNDTEYQLPSKVVEYAGAGKPVLSLAKHPNDSSISFFRGYSRALCIVESENDFKRVLAQVSSFLRDPPVLDEQQQQEWLERYQVPSIADTYRGLLTEH